MVDIALQIKEYGNIVPFSVEDRDRLRDFKPNQILRAQISGVETPRSYRQLKKYWAVCTKTAQNNEHPEWQTKDLVDYQCRTQVPEMKKPGVYTIRPDGTKQHEYLTVSYANLKHLEACRYFDIAFEIMAYVLDITVEELLRNANG